MLRSAQGDLSPLLHWLRAKVHGQGSRYEFNELLREATGKPLDPGGFPGPSHRALSHLNRHR